MKYTILHLNASNFYGGPEKQIIEHLKRIDKTQFNGLVVSFLESGMPSAILAKAQEINIKNEALNMNGLFDLSVIKKLKTIILSNQVNLICTHGYKSTVLGSLIAKKLSIPVVTFSRGYTAEDKKVAFYEWLERRKLQKVDGIISVSKGQKDKLENQYNINHPRHWVVHNSVALENLNSFDRQAFRSKLFNEYSIPAYAVLGVAAGRLSPEKGHRFLIEAAATVNKQRKDIYFLICGDGSQIDHLQELSQKLALKNHIIFTGFRQDIPHIFSIMDFMVLPSLTEGLPNVVLEAFIQKKPVVVTNVGGVPELVVNDENGYMVSPESPNELAKAILKLVNNPEKSQSMGIEGYNKVTKYFSFDEQNKKLEKIYLSLLNG